MSVRRTLGTAVPLVLTMLALAPPAIASHERFVTIAARYCPSYTAITANRARNDIMESLANLGADTPYGKPGVPNVVVPSVEGPNQPLCQPLANWVFTLGAGYQTRAVDGVWGSLAKVLEPYDTTILTQASVPLLDDAGSPTTSTIQGATSIQLTPEQVTQIGNGKLWIQGGTPTLPITDPVTYAFGALRCATDNLNGDNVEWIDYPPDVRHVFCFAYYVRPAPTSGTIDIVKEIDAPAGTPAQTVPFVGDISYEPGGRFNLTASRTVPGRISFIRAAGRSWSFREELTTGSGQLDQLTCISATGASSSTIDLPNTGASVQLGAGDTVTCTFRNSYRRPPSGLALRKVTTGGTGVFGFTARGENGSADLTARTLEEGLAATAEPRADAVALPGGRYRVEEEPPPDVPGGDWALEDVRCDGVAQEIEGLGAIVNLRDNAGQTCTFFNRFTPAGSITLWKRTLGGTGTTRFQIRPQGTPAIEYEQVATTQRVGLPARATGDDTSEIPLGLYAIQETIASTRGTRGQWRVAAVVCDGQLQPSEQGRILIALTPENPTRDCTFTNQLVRRPEPPEPPTPPTPPTPPFPPPAPVPDPAPGGVAGVAASNPSDVRVTKIVRPRRIRLGESARYTITVRNLGPATARAVTVAERTPSRSARLSVRTSQGRCHRGPPRFCAIGRLAAGARATIRVTYRPERAGRHVNVVAVNTGTWQGRRPGRRARAVLVVVPRVQPRFTG